MKRGDVVRLKRKNARWRTQQGFTVSAWQSGVVIKIVKKPSDAAGFEACLAAIRSPPTQCIIYWSENIKSIEFVDNLEMSFPNCAIWR
jgi:hypothetical protein